MFVTPEKEKNNECQYPVFISPLQEPFVKQSGKKGKRKRPKPHPRFKKKGMDPKTRRIAIHSFLVLNSRQISVRDAASFFSVSKSLMHEIMQEDSAEYLRSHPPPKKPQESLSPMQEGIKDSIVDLLTEDKSHSLRSISSALKERGKSASRQTVWRTMKSLRMSYKRRPARPWCGPGGEVVWKGKRLEFAKAHVGDNPVAFIFLDECMIRSLDLRKFEWCLPSQSPSPIDNPQNTASCHVFGAIGTNGFRLLVDLSEYSSGKRGGVTSEDYVRVIREKLVPAMRKFFGYLNRGKPEGERIRPIIVQDGAPAHRSPKIREILEDAGYKLLSDWPGYSPDFNPIENCWGLSKKQLNKELAYDKSNTEANRRRIWKATQKYFNALSRTYLQNLILSFRTRMEICIKEDGGYTGY